MDAIDGEINLTPQHSEFEYVSPAGGIGGVVDARRGRALVPVMQFETATIELEKLRERLADVTEPAAEKKQLVDGPSLNDISQDVVQKTQDMSASAAAEISGDAKKAEAEIAKKRYQLDLLADK